MTAGSSAVHDVIVVGGGFAGVTAAREARRGGASVLLLEARERLGGRTWATDWAGARVELGGAYVHWHQAHTWSEITRAGLAVDVAEDPDVAYWFTGQTRHEGSAAERDAVLERGWRRFVAGVEEALPRPHDPLFALDRLARFDRMTIAERMEEIELTDEERDLLTGELEGVAHGRLDDAGAVTVLRWHALSGYTLALTQYACGGRVTLRAGTGALLAAIADEERFERRLGTPVAAVAQSGEGVEVTTRGGETFPARAVVVAVPLNALGAISFEPKLSEPKAHALSLGQASRGIKIFIRARGETRAQSAVKGRHPFGYLDTEADLGDGTQLLVGFGPDAEALDAGDLPDVQRALDEILPENEVVGATAHGWLSDEFSRGTWAVHRPGWYTRHHGEMRRPEGRVVLAGSDLANGWAGFIDGAIESGLRAGREALRRL